MAKYSSSVNYNIKTTLDSSGITKLQSEIAKTQTELRKMQSLEIIGDKQYKEAMQKLDTLRNALNKSFNPQLGMLNLGNFKKELSKAGMGVKDLGSAFSAAGSVGERSFNNLVGRLGKIDTGMQSVSKSADKVFNTIGNTVRWGVIASGFQTLLNNAHKAVQYMRDLDKSLTNIRMVTDYSKTDMKEFAEYANRAAQALGSTTTAYTNASLIFAQQGYNLEDSSKLGEYSIKLANVTGQQTSDTSNQITSYMNAFQMDIEDIGSALDKWAEVANVSAADVKELSVATQKAGSTASTVGVNMDQLAAQIATIESVTRDAPENIGNGLKTIYARFADLSLGKTLDDGMDLGQVTGTLDKMGVEVINKETGVMNDVGVIIEDLMEVWDTLDQGQKSAAANSLAGKYQMNRLMALMENSDMYSSYKASAETADGTMDTMQDEYLDSIEGKLQALYASAQGLVGELFSTESVGPFLDGLKDALNLMTRFTESIGGGQNLLLGLGATATKVFSNQIGRGIIDTINNLNVAKTKMTNLNESKNLLAGMGLNGPINKNNQYLLDAASSGLNNSRFMSEDQQLAHNKRLESSISLANDYSRFREKEQANMLATNAAYRLAGLNEDVITKDKKGNIDYAKAQNTLSDPDLKIQPEQMAAITKNIQDLDNKAIKAAQSVQKIQDAFGKGVKSQFAEAIEKARININELTNQTGISDEKIQPFLKALKKVQSEANQTGADAVKVSKDIEKLLKEMQDFRSLTNQVAANPKASIYGSAKDIDKTQQTKQQYQERSLADQKVWTAEQQRMEAQKFAGAAVNFAGSIGQMAFAVQSLQSLGSIWNRDDLEVGEKILNTITNVGIALPMVITGIQSMIDLGKTGKAATIAYAIAKQAETAAEMANTVAIEANTAAKGRAQNAVKSSLIPYGASNKLIAANTVENVKNAASSKAAAAGTMTFSNALKTLIVSNPHILAIAAALAAVGLAAKGVYDWYTQDARAAEEAAEEATNFKTVMEDVNNRFTDFKDSFDSYRTAKEEFSNLTKGTKEWRDALFDVNQQVLDLLDKFPELLPYVERTADGMLVITEAGYQAVYDDQMNQLTNSQIMSVGADKAAKEAQIVAEGTSVRRKISWGDDVVLEDGTVMSGSGTLSKEDFAALENAWKEGVKLTSDSEVAEIFGKDISDPMVQAIVDSSDKLISYFETSEYQRENTDLKAANAMLGLLNQDQSFVNRTDFNKDEFASYAASIAEQEAAKYVDDYSGMSMDELADEYIANTWGADSGYTHEEEGDELIFKDEQGEQVAALNKENIINSLAYSDAMMDVANRWNSILDRFESILGSEASQVSANVGSSLLSNMEGKEGTFDFSEMGEAEKASLKTSLDAKETNEDVADYLGITDEQAEEHGYDNKKAMAKDYKSQLSDSVKADEDQSISDERIANVSSDDASNEERQKLLNDVDSMKDYKKVIEDLNVTEKERRDMLASLAEEYPELSQQEANLAKARKEQADAYNNTTKADRDQAKVLREKEKALKAAEASGKGVKKAQQEYNKEMKKATPEAKRYAKALNENEKATRILRNNLRRQEWSKAAKDCKQYTKALNEGNKGSKSYVKAINQISNSLRDLTGTDMTDKELSSFIEENKDLITDWTNGVEGAGSKLQVLFGYASDGFDAIASSVGMTRQEMEALTSDWVFDLTGRADMSNLIEGLGILDDKMLNTKQEGLDLVNMLQNFGATQLELYSKDTGKKVSEIDLEGISADGEVDDKELAQLQDYVSKLFSGKFFIKGLVPDKDLKSMKPIGDGGGGGGKPSTSSGGGSGGGSKKASKKKIEKKDKEYDRYKRVNHQLERITASYEKLANETDRLAGKAWIKNLEEQNEKLEEQNKKLERKLQLQKQEMYGTARNPNSGIKDKLAGAGIKFDKYGAMTNYNQIHNQFIQAYNNAAAAGNEKAAEQAEKALERFEEWASRYEELAGEIEDTQSQIQDNSNTIEDNMIAIFNATSEAIQEVQELNELLDELETTMMGMEVGDLNDPFAQLHGSADALLDYFDRDFVNTLQGTMDGISIWGKNMDYDSIDGKGHGSVSATFLHGQEVLENMRLQRQGKDNVFGKNSAAALEAAQAAVEAMAEELTNMAEKWAEMQEAILNYEESIAEKIEERQAKYQNISDQLEYQKNLTELIYGEQAYALLDQIYDAQERNNNAMLEERQRQVAILEQELAAMAARGEQETQLYKQMEERLTEAQASLQEMVISSLETIREEYEKTIESVLNAWTINALGGSDLDWMDTQWELIERNSEQYLDNVNAAYETQKLQNKYLEMLDGEINLHNQQLITQQMNEQLEYLREKDKLSEYDVAYANAQLEILQKRIALEEAQQNKTQMKLKRDSQGNYSYVYTANEANTKSAEGDLLDAENAAYNLSKENMIEMQNNSMSALKDAYSTIQDIWTNANLTVEEKAGRTQEVIDSLKEYLAGTAEQLSVSEQNLINDFFAMVDGMSTENSDRLTDAFNELVEGNNSALNLIDERFNTSITEWLKNLDDFNDSCDDMMEDVTDAANEMAKDIDDVAESVQQDFDNIQSSVEDCSEATQDLTNSTEEFFDTIASQTGIMDGYQKGLSKMKDEIVSLQNEYSDTVQALNDEITTLKRQVIDLGGTPAGTNPSNPGAEGGGTSGDGKLNAGDKVTLKSSSYAEYAGGPYISDPKYGKGSKLYVQKVDGYVTRSIGGATWVHLGTGATYNQGVNDVGWVRKRDISGYDTGGYTGSWNNGDPAAKNGKLAYLHQKELVLNETDTKNLLAAVEMVRTLTDQIKNSSITQAISTVSGKVGTQSAGDTIEQRVAIEANFPNVKDATEIEQALLSLSDQAYQWAHRYR